jgi:hypothetical protein
MHIFLPFCFLRNRGRPCFTSLCVLQRQEHRKQTQESTRKVSEPRDPKGLRNAKTNAEEEGTGYRQAPQQNTQSRTGVQPQATPAAQQPWQTTAHENGHVTLNLYKTRAQFTMGAGVKRPSGDSERAGQSDIPQGTNVLHGLAEELVYLGASRHRTVTGCICPTRVRYLLLSCRGVVVPHVREAAAM